MHVIEFIHDLAIIMLAAGIVTVVFHLLRQPVVLGYIVAGVLIGPHTPPYTFVTNEETIRTLAELGVVFLLFSLGLEFSLRHLRQVGATALVSAIAGIVTMLSLGYAVGRAFDWNVMDALFLGAMLSISSTTITIKALEDLKLKKQHFAQVVFAILIVEDVLAIAMIALLASAAKTGAIDSGEVMRTLGGLTVFLVASLVIGILTIPRLLDFVARFNSNEMLLVSVLGLLFGFCLVVVRLGYNAALGAFVIGAIIAETGALHRIERVIAPVRDMFSAIFFVAVGLMLDPVMLLDYAGPVAAATLAVIIGKSLARTAGSFAAGQDARTSLRIGMSLAQIGEFSFIIATLGLTLKATSAFLYPIAVCVSAVTTLFTPYPDPWRRPAGAAHPRAHAGRSQPYPADVYSLAAEPCASSATAP
jgi:CPA2 family monovalent cation:H+ antiporter-2